MTSGIAEIYYNVLGLLKHNGMKKSIKNIQSCASFLLFWILFTKSKWRVIVSKNMNINIFKYIYILTWEM